MATWIACLALAISALTVSCDGARLLQVSPGWSASHIMFNYRLAETLTEAGHNVTVMIMGMTVPNREELLKKTPKGVESFALPLPLDTTNFRKFITIVQDSAFQQVDMNFLKGMVNSYRLMTKHSCLAMLLNHEILERMRNARFDMILSQPFAFCPFALAHRLSIVNLAWVAPGNFLSDENLWAAGIPNFPSCAPSAVSYFTDKMSFKQRLLNTIYYVKAKIISNSGDISDTEGAIASMPPYHTPNDPDLWELTQRVQTIFINGESVLDLPRQLIPGMSYLGALYKTDSKALAPNWQTLMDKSDRGVILFSFGTITNTSLMPMEMKKAFFDAFQNLSDYTVIWKLEGQQPEGLREAKHIKVVDWMPQWDLLTHPKMKLFITHSGYNSFLEGAQAAVPMVLMPLFGDQYSNAARAERLGIGKILHKTSADAKSIYETLRSVLFEDRYYKRARTIASQLNDKVVPNSYATTRQIERIIKSSRIWPRMKVPQKLSYIQYFCLDVIGLFLAIIFVACYCAAKVFLIILRLLMSRKVQKYV